MSDFPQTSVIRLARDSGLENQTLTIEGDNANGFTLKYAEETWNFPPGADKGCVLAGGGVLEVQGSCTRSPGGSIFNYIIGITRDPQTPPDNHVVEWVAEDEG